MRIKIYQINAERDIHNVGFMGFDRLKRLQGSSEIDSKIYDLIYDKSMDFEDLEDIFRSFNIDHPKDFRGHSLSVSDVIEISNSSSIENGFYFCDSIGFKKIDFHPKACRISNRMNKDTGHSKLEEKLGQTLNRVFTVSQSVKEASVKRNERER